MSRRILTAVTTGGAIIGLILGVIQLLDWFRSPPQPLKGSVSYSDFELPPGVLAAFTKVYELSDPDHLQKELSIDLSPIKDVRAREQVATRTASQLSRFLRENLPSRLPEPFESLSGYCRVDILNDGTEAVEDVNLRVPSARYFLEARAGSEPRHGRTSELVSLGQLQPRERTTVQVWTGYPGALIATEQLVLTHRRGVGELTINRPVSGIWYSLSRDWPLILYVLISVIALFGAVISGIMALRSSQGGKAKPSQEGKGEKQDLLGGSQESRRRQEGTTTTVSNTETQLDEKGQTPNPL